MVFKPFVNAGTLVLVPTHPECLVQKARTPTTRAPSPAFPVRRVRFPAKKEMLNATDVQLGIYNLNQNNQNVIESKLDQSWPKEDRPRSLYHKDLKLMPRTHPVLRHAQRERLETNLQTHCVKIAQLEHPAHPVPQHAKPATKESLMVKVVVLVTIV